MFAIFQNEWVLFGTLAAIGIIGIIGWRKVGGWLFGRRNKSEEPADSEA